MKCSRKNIRGSILCGEKEIIVRKGNAVVLVRGGGGLRSGRIASPGSQSRADCRNGQCALNEC
jgi:hypothetical protein